MWREELIRWFLDLFEEEVCVIFEIFVDEIDISGENGEGDEESKFSVGKIFGCVDEEIFKC